MFPPMGAPGTPPLDGPPPSPTAMGEPAGGPLSMRGLAPPGQMPAGQMPPEVLTGVTQAAQTMNQLIDSFMQVAPDKAQLLNTMKQLLAQFLAELMPAGAQPVSPTATGPAFPGGGIDRGIAGPGAV